MLIEFRVRNFRSFKDEQVLSMVLGATSDNSLLEDNSFPVEQFGERRLLRTAAIYGPNASGKTNLIAGFEFIRRFIKSAIDRDPDDEIPVEPFRLDAATQNAPSEFELTFIQEGVRYQYGLKLDRQRIHEEWLYAYPKGQRQKWFERKINSATGADWSLGSDSFGSKLTGKREDLKLKTRPNTPFLSVAAKFNHPQLSNVYRWLSVNLRVVRADSPWLMANSFTARRSKADETFRQQVGALLRAADFGVRDFIIEEREHRADELPPIFNADFRAMLLNQKTQVVRTVHAASGQPDRDILFLLQDESLGTQRFFELSGILLDTLANGWTLAVDELDASLHPNLVRELVALFHNRALNSRNAQLIFNTHDTSLLDSTFLRRDQIWFTEKDRHGASHLYSLFDYVSPRKGEALQKNYLLGRYGAVPILAESLAEYITHGKAPQAQTVS